MRRGASNKLETSSANEEAVALNSSSVPTLIATSLGCFTCKSAPNSIPLLIVQQNGGSSSSSRRQSNIVSSSIPERSENEEDADRIEAELDEMARYIGPVAKSLFTPVVAPLVDANSFADALGVSPLYKQKETQRWSSALHIYRQMSSQDPNSINQQTPHRLSEEDELAQLYSSQASNGSDAIVGDFDENLISAGRPAAPPPREIFAQPIAIPASVASTNNNRQSQKIPSAASSMKSPSSTFGSSLTSRLGFMTPPPASLFAAHQHSAANYVVSPPRRMSSSVSPNEASSLNSLELEAIAAVHELQFAVKDIYVSEMLPRTSELIFLNVTTLEGQAYCVELTMKGWRVTSLRHDCMNGDIHHLDLHIEYFETIYALMDRISPDYRRRFTDALVKKLSAIQAERGVGEEKEKPVANNNNRRNGNDENDFHDRLEQEQRQTFT